MFFFYVLNSPLVFLSVFVCVILCLFFFFSFKQELKVTTDLTDLNYISKKQTVSTYCLLVKTTPQPPFDPVVFFFSPLAEKSEFPAVLCERPRRPEPDAGPDY